MNEKVIEKIADELGVAVGTAGDFIADMLPQYAALQIMNTSSKAFILLLTCVAAIVVICVCIPRWKKANENKDWDSRFTYLIILIAAAIWLIVFGTCIITLIAGIAGWYMFPEAMLLDMAMEAVDC